MPFTGPGSWSAREVAQYLATGTRPALMRQVIARWPHPGDFEAAHRTGGRAFAEAGWPTPARPTIAVPAGGWMALIGTPDYPAQLEATQAPPLVLFGLGDITALRTPGLGVVGTRDMTPYGQVVATTAVQAAAPPTPVISGLARGVDTCAHTAALTEGLPTVAVLATGPDCVYPTQNQDLAAAILTAGGAIISEHPFGTTPETAPHRTPAPLASRLMARNRIIAGLSAALVLAEGQGRSGAMHTVWSMLGMGRPVLVAAPRAHARTLPGAQGPLALAADRARTREQLVAMGAPAAVADRWAGRSPLASGCASDRDDLTLLVRTALAFSPRAA